MDLDNTKTLSIEALPLSGNRSKMITKHLARNLRVMLSSVQKPIAKSENPLHVGKGSDPDFAVTRGPKSKFHRQLRVLRTI